MSTYLMADAINNFAKTFKKATDERNKIEKDRLELEKTKFEFYKAFEEEKFKLNKQQLDVDEYDNFKCDHDWRVVGSVAGTVAMYKVFICSKCGAQQTEKTIVGRDGTYDVCLIDETSD